MRTGSSRGRACGSRVGLPWLVWLLCLVVERGRCVERGRLSAGCEAERVNVERVSFDCC